MAEFRVGVLVSLSLTTLQGGKGAPDNFNQLVAFLQQPMTYDSSE